MQRPTHIHNGIPSRNGQGERRMGLIAEGISMYFSEDQKDWDNYLKFVIFAHNTTVHTVTLY